MIKQNYSNKDLNIVFIQPKYAHYRHELFSLLNREYNITFVFLKREGSEYDYPTIQRPDLNWRTVNLDSNIDKTWWIKLFRLIIRIKPDAVVSSINSSTQSIIAAIIRQFYKVPFILYSESWTEKYRNKNRASWEVMIHKIINNWVTLKADSLVVGGSNSKAYHQVLGVDTRKIFLAYQSTIDHSLKAENYNKVVGNDTSIRILYFSRIVESKGLGILIMSFKRLVDNYHNIKLIIAGDGPFKPNCEALVKELQVPHVVFLGSIPNEEAWRVFIESDIFVLPCSGIKRGEGWGLVINEAASMSLPIITTNAVGAVGDLVINEKNGFVVQAGDIFELSNAIRILVEDGLLRKSMGEESRKLFEEKNSYQKMFIGFKNAILYAIENANNRPRIR
jgi:glycosyltransferase involved in cell wall biosynthesis